jgi:uncharacterized radical SAM superfamily Fe-S cluster-containing enzyme
MQRVDADIVEQRGSVFLVKHCVQHGVMRELLEEDAAFYRRRLEFDKPGTPSRMQTEHRLGCPFDCGLCPHHQQHTCIGLIEVTNACDLSCPLCYAVSGTGSFLPLDTIERMMDLYVSSEYEQPDILQISGGEPTLHPQILDIIALARTKGFKYVMLNTNGLRIARDDAFAEALGRFKGSFELYLQFDGFHPAALKKLRGRDISDVKRAVFRQIAHYKIPTTLVATIARGVNDDQVGNILSFAMEADFVRGVNFQPMAYFGRLPDGIAPQDRVTLTGIIRRIEEQTKGAMTMQDFVSLPCHVDRVALTYLQRSNAGEWVPLPRRLDLREFVPAIKNSFAFSLDDALESTACCSLTRGKKQTLGSILLNAAKLKTLQQRAKYLNEDLFRITVTSFIDAYNFDLQSMQKECVHIITPDLRKIPFSAYNMIHRAKACASTNS